MEFKSDFNYTQKREEKDNNKKVVGKTTDFKLIFIMEIAIETVMQLRL